MKTTYLIRYRHTSPSTATSKREALRMVRRELGVSRLAIVECSDGTYLYRSVADRASDDTGASAAAVIESPDQRESH